VNWLLKITTFSITIVYWTNRFHVAEHLFSNRSQKMSKCGKDKKVAHETIAECVTVVLTTFWGHLWPITEEMHGNMECTFCILSRTANDVWHCIHWPDGINNNNLELIWDLRHEWRDLFHQTINTALIASLKKITPKTSNYRNQTCSTSGLDSLHELCELELFVLASRLAQIEK